MIPFIFPADADRRVRCCRTRIGVGRRPGESDHVGEGFRRRGMYTIIFNKKIIALPTPRYDNLPAARCSHDAKNDPGRDAAMARSRSAAVDGEPAARPAKPHSGETPPQKVPDQSGGASPPTWRRLEIFAIDPSVDTSIANVAISRCVLPVRWEPLDPGPIGEYIEVIDVDPSSNCVYDPVDLDDKHLVAQNGVTPSEGSPQFHQQMVYAVAMKTIENFERALGRRIIWSERLYDEVGKIVNVKKESDRYVRRLRIYPHALREANAYYSPPKKSLLFGYFNAATTDPRDELPGRDGLRRAVARHHRARDHARDPRRHASQAPRSHEPGYAGLPRGVRRYRGDLPAFHAARAAARPDAADARGSQSRRQFPVDPGRPVRPGHDARRGSPQRPGQVRLERRADQGGPVGAVADDRAARSGGHPGRRGLRGVPARSTSRGCATCRRIATGGTGVLPTGDIHPDLARRFADEAARAAQQVLTICIRALDYLPPVDVTFGDYLRALITADIVVNPDDPRRDRVAFIEAFRNHGIYPLDVRSLGEDSLRLDSPARRSNGGRSRSTCRPRKSCRTMANAWEVADGDSDFRPDSDGPNVGSRAMASPDPRGRLARWSRRSSGDSGSLSGTGRTMRRPTRRTEFGPVPAEFPLPKDHRRSTYLLIKRFSKFLYQWLSKSSP